MTTTITREPSEAISSELFRESNYISGLGPSDAVNKELEVKSMQCKIFGLEVFITPPPFLFCE
jgi:hypothetical protein